MADSPPSSSSSSSSSSPLQQLPNSWEALGDYLTGKFPPQHHQQIDKEVERLKLEFLDDFGSFQATTLTDLNQILLRLDILGALRPHLQNLKPDPTQIPAPTPDRDVWEVLGRVKERIDQTDLRMARLVLGEQPSSAAKSYASSFKEYYEVSTVLAKPDFDFKKRRACWKKFQEMLAKFKTEKENAEKNRFEAKFQELLLCTLNDIFSTKLNFVDTSKRNNIASPLKPDITVVGDGCYAHHSTVLGLIEVKDCLVGNEECGQVVNAVAIAYDKQPEKRPIWGFVISPTTNFACCCVESGSFQMANGVAHEDLLSFLRNVSLGPKVVFPTLKDYTVTCELGRGLTSRVFCVKDNRGDWVFKFPKPDEENATRIVAKEATIMNEMGVNQAVRENPHLAKFVGRVSATFQGQDRDGILLFPPATNKKVPLALEDVTELAGALFDLHEAGFLHRDVSPANIGHYVDQDLQCRPFLRDFGFAVALTKKGENEEKLSFAGTVVSASNRILGALSRGRKEILVGRRDDLESLCKSLILLACGSRVGVDEEALAGRAEGVLNFWEKRGSIDDEGLTDILESKRYGHIRRYFTSLPSRTRISPSQAHTPPPEKIQTPPSAQIPSPSAPSTPSFAQSPFALDRHQPHTQDSPELHFPPTDFS